MYYQIIIIEMNIHDSFKMKVIVIIISTNFKMVLINHLNIVSNIIGLIIKGFMLYLY